MAASPQPAPLHLVPRTFRQCVLHYADLQLAAAQRLRDLVAGDPDNDAEILALEQPILEAWWGVQRCFETYRGCRDVQGMA